MKTNLIYILIATVAFTAACSNNAGDKKSQLESLKKQQAEIAEQIKNLEAEVGTDSTATGGAASGRTLLIAVTEMQPQKFTHYLEVQGKVDSDKNIMLVPKGQGAVTRINVKEGQWVKKGQVLAAQDAAIIQSQLNQAKTGLEMATTMYEKQKRLWEQKIGSEVQFLQAKTQKESAEAALASLRETYELSLFIAPFDGVVDEVNLREGEVPNPAAGNGIRIINPSDYKVVAELAEFYISKVKEGNEVTIVLPDANRNFNVKLNTVSRVINEVNRTFSIEIDIPTLPELKANMLAYVKIQDYTNPKAFVVPINAIQQSSEGQYVFVAENNKASKRLVKLGQSYGGKAEILTGLQPGDKVITTGQNELVDGQPIQISTQQQG